MQLRHIARAKTWQERQADEERVRADHAHAPLLVTASGLPHYFERERVLGLMRMPQGFGAVELPRDAAA